MPHPLPTTVARLLIAGLGLATGLTLSPADAQAQKRKAPPAVADPGTSSINSWTVGLAAGRLEGAPLRLAAELARELDDGNNMRVMPIVTRGPFDNIYDLLQLKGVDLAVVSGDILEHVKTEPSLAPYRSKIAFVMQLAPAEVHLLVGPGINSVADLEGKAVNFNTQGTQAAYTGPLLFDRLGVKIERRFDPHQQAMSQLVEGKTYAGVLWVSSKPIEPLARRKFPEGFKLLAIPADEKLLDYYLPSRLEAADYPTLLTQGQGIETVAVPTVLAAFNFTKNPDRQRRMQRFVDYLFKRLPGLQSKPGYDAKWKDVNLAAAVPGWQRLPAMQTRLDAEAAARRIPNAALTTATQPSVAPNAKR